MAVQNSTVSTISEGIYMGLDSPGQDVYNTVDQTSHNSPGAQNTERKLRDPACVGGETSQKGENEEKETEGKTGVGRDTYTRSVEQVGSGDDSDTGKEKNLCTSGPELPELLSRLPGSWGGGCGFETQKTLDSRCEVDSPPHLSGG
ncbi:hypothetical protein AAFF_G00320660 [Aldrovandia affinis]|uniref:Uncharacterized protein n=1 Tax=Aldrovandia affinis TaxID=143900 RepID=A0AAD7W0R2_9TELE|nr:hypothetical protein AAFF_G00320660 [Aldrovandia affinis]